VRMPACPGRGMKAPAPFCTDRRFSSECGHSPTAARKKRPKSRGGSAYWRDALIWINWIAISAALPPGVLIATASYCCASGFAPLRELFAFF
jgi:hypothetical protein